jgi:hypothetical protein
MLRTTSRNFHMQRNTLFGEEEEEDVLGEEDVFT